MASYRTIERNTVTVVRTRDMALVGRVTVKNGDWKAARRRACRIADRLDNAYGAYVHRLVCCDVEGNLF